MKIIGIIGAMDIETTYIKEILKVEQVIEQGYFKFYIGEYETLKIVLAESGVGKVNAAACTQILLERFKATHIINFGIAGSLRRDVRICDIVIGHSVAYHDVSKEEMKMRFSHKESFYGDEYLERLAIEAFSDIELKECNYHLGEIVSGDNFIANEPMRRRIIAKTRGCCVDMEAAAIAQVCFLNNKPFITMKCVSSDLDEECNEYNTEIDNICAFGAARFLIRFLKVLAKY